ncbi:hypothetical protein FACS1894176_04630 [Bacteroidia bacterium]|nr:hypothetical protein FACS1894176_04630 [Bacteroidia bacterium]
MLESVTSKPQKQTAYATYNSGYLEYKITPTTTQVEIKNISFTVDEIVYYGSDKVLTGAIKITSLVDGQQMNEVTMDIKQSNTPATSRTCSITQINHTYLSGTQFNTESLGCVLRLGFLYTKYSTYIKNKKVYYYYPTALQFVSASPAGTYTHYPASGLVVFDTPNSAYLTLSTTGVLPGTYTAPVITYQEIEMYDGTIIRINFKNLSVVVQDAATLINKLTLQTANRNYNPDL